MLILRKIGPFVLEPEGHPAIVQSLYWLRDADQELVATMVAKVEWIT